MRSSLRMTEEINVYSGSGYVFADLGLPNNEAAKLLEIDQPKVSVLVRGKLSGFSTERLFR
jgi:hypothetical protein